MNEISPHLLDDLKDAEANALAAHKRWRASRRTKARGWTCYTLGFATGAGLAALLIAASGYLP